MTKGLCGWLFLVALFLPGIARCGPVELTTFEQHREFCKPLIERSELTRSSDAAEKEIKRLEQELKTPQVTPKDEFETTEHYDARRRKHLEGLNTQKTQQEQIRDNAVEQLRALQVAHPDGPLTNVWVVCRIPVKVGKYDADTETFEKIMPVASDYCFGRDKGVPHVLHIPYTFQAGPIAIPAAKTLKALSDGGALYAHVVLTGVTIRCKEEEVVLPRSGGGVVGEVLLKSAIIIASEMMKPGSTRNSLAATPPSLKETVLGRVILIDHVDSALVFRLSDSQGNLIDLMK